MIPQIIRKMTATVFSYATEDEEKVANTLVALFPDEYIENPPFEIYREDLVGQYDEPLIKFEVEINKKRILAKVFEWWKSQLTESEKKFLYRHLENMTDVKAKTYHLRFDKFKAAKGELTLGEGSNTIKVVLKFVLYTKDLTPLKQELIDLGLIMPPS